MSAKPLMSQAKKVRVADHLYERLEKMADDGRKQGVSITGLADQALKRFFEQLDKRELDPALTPRTPEEEDVIRMVLAVYRNPYDRAEEHALKLLTDLYSHRTKKVT